MQRFWQALSGTGLGLVTGILIGLSVTPVVATVVAGITAGLGAFLGFQKSDSESSNSSSDIRLGFFGLSCVLAVFLGLYVRTHRLVSPGFLDQKHSFLEEFNAWKQLPGMSDDQARSLVIYRQLNLMPSTLQPGKAQSAAPQDSVLFSTPQTAGLNCSFLDEGRYRTEAQRIDAIERSLLGNADARLAKLLSELKTLHSDDARRTLLAGIRIGAGCS